MTADYLDNNATDNEYRIFGKKLPLIKGVFPRPFAISSLPCRDITMQNVVGEGDFEHYQGIWRMQPLPNCNPSGGDATRLTYAVELKPKGILPVRLVEGRIASDLKKNLMAIRDHVEVRYGHLSG
jgi:Polyketide cyclase / dehydrase and lipid transport